MKLYVYDVLQDDLMAIRDKVSFAFDIAFPYANIISITNSCVYFSIDECFFEAKYEIDKNIVCFHDINEVDLVTYSDDIVDSIIEDEDYTEFMDAYVIERKVLKQKKKVPVSEVINTAKDVIGYISPPKVSSIGVDIDLGDISFTKTFDKTKTFLKTDKDLIVRALKKILKKAKEDYVFYSPSFVNAILRVLKNIEKDPENDSNYAIALMYIYTVAPEKIKYVNLY